MATPMPRLSQWGHMPAPAWLPPFTTWPLMVAIALRPATEALYEYDSVKYAYMLLLFFAGFLAYAGNGIGALIEPSQKRATDRTLLTLFVGVVVYFCYLAGISLANNGALAVIFKIVSPFIFFLLVAPNCGPWLTRAALVSGLIVVVGNGALLPTAFGWTFWGDVRTFKGFYYFKTDLAYALCFACLFVAISQRFRFTPLLVATLALAAVEVVLANSRLNYLSFLILSTFIALRSGMRLVTLVRFGLLAAVVAVTAIVLYDPSRALGFDWNDPRALTQGRTTIWDVLINDGLLKATPGQLLFGRGLFGDILLFRSSVSEGEGHNAHNEWLQLLTNQGILGTIAYWSLWWLTLRASRIGYTPAWARGTLTLTLLLFLMQSFTAGVSTIATKTWPIAIVLLILRSIAGGEAETAGSGRRTNADRRRKRSDSRPQMVPASARRGSA